MAELESIIEKRLIDQLCSDESQWTYRPDIRNEKQLWDNFKYILEQNNKAKLKDIPLSESEFAKIKNDVSHASFYDAGKWLVGENGKVSFDKFHPLAFDWMNKIYLSLGQKVGNAYKDGLALR